MCRIANPTIRVRHCKCRTAGYLPEILLFRGDTNPGGGHTEKRSGNFKDRFDIKIHTGELTQSKYMQTVAHEYAHAYYKTFFNRFGVENHEHSWMKSNFSFLMVR